MVEIQDIYPAKDVIIDCVNLIFTSTHFQLRDFTLQDYQTYWCMHVPIIMFIGTNCMLLLTGIMLYS